MPDAWSHTFPRTWHGGIHNLFNYLKYLRSVEALTWGSSYRNGSGFGLMVHVYLCPHATHFFKGKKSTYNHTECMYRTWIKHCVKGGVSIPIFLFFVSAGDMNTFEERLFDAMRNYVHLYDSLLNNYYNNKQFLRIIPPPLSQKDHAYSHMLSRANVHTHACTWMDFVFLCFLRIMCLRFCLKEQ